MATANVSLCSLQLCSTPKLGTYMTHFAEFYVEYNIPEMGKKNTKYYMHVNKNLGDKHGCKQRSEN